jgi:hypothetical protein
MQALCNQKLPNMNEVIISTSVATAVLVSLAIWLSRIWITERLKADIKLDNDSKLEEIRSELQRTNTQLSGITSAGGQAYSQVQAALLPNKIKAIERMWASVLAWNEMTAASMFVAVLPIDWVRKYGSDPSTKENFEMLLRAPNHLEFLKERNNVESVRPFVSEQSWALYSAYNSFYISRISKASFFLISTFDHAEVFERVNERRLVEKSATKEILEKYDANILDGTNEYLNYLKEEMVKEFHIELSGERDSTRAANNAAEIIKVAESLASNASETLVPPGDSPLGHPNA